MTLEEISRHEIAGVLPGGGRSITKIVRDARPRTRQRQARCNRATSCAIVRHRAATNAWTAAHPSSNVRPSPRKSIGLCRPPPEAKRPTTGRDARPARISFASSSAQQRVIIGRPMCDNRTRSSSHESAAVRNECAGYRAAVRARARMLSLPHAAYGPFNPYIPIRSTTIGKSRVAIDPIAMRTSWRSNSDIASVTSIGYPRLSASGESSTKMHSYTALRGSHQIPPPNDPNSHILTQPVATVIQLYLFLISFEILAPCHWLWLPSVLTCYHGYSAGRGVDPAGGAPGGG
ncbi:hypothetical protein F511_24596 [Dorcoceras hygrometricum]|uniref:Uncharacterized protein n=1 Tax=Dorcoceras hygrometricum TaxID=472368 RepID=A0A2Z7CRJ3_9LAMI|nr:hypothetical protein F511_24596 [Dorcoceras hygrometricum]